MIIYKRNFDENRSIYFFLKEGKSFEPVYNKKYLTAEKQINT